MESYELHLYKMFELNVPLVYRSAFSDDFPSDNNQADQEELPILISILYK